MTDSRGNLFRMEPGVRNGGELFQTLWTGRGVRVERIVSWGQVSPPGFWYDQAEDEWVAILEGQAELEREDGVRVTLGPGDWLLIPARCRHRVTFTSSGCVWLAVFAIAGEESR